MMKIHNEHFGRLRSMLHSTKELNNTTFAKVMVESYIHAPELHEQEVIPYVQSHQSTLVIPFDYDSYAMSHKLFAQYVRAMPFACFDVEVRTPHFKTLIGPDFGARIHALRFQNRTGLPGVRLLAQSPYLENLKILELSDNNITDNALTMLCHGASDFKLTTLDLRQNDIGDEGVMQLVNWPAVVQLETLLLEDTCIDASGFKALATSTNMRNVRHLNCAWTYINDAALKGFSSTPCLESLQILKLHLNHITDVGVAELTRARLSQLEEIVLNYNKITDNSITHLLTCFTWPSLRTLSLEETNITARGLAALAKQTNLPGLKNIYASGEHLRGDAAHAELVEAGFEFWASSETWFKSF